MEGVANQLQTTSRLLAGEAGPDPHAAADPGPVSRSQELAAPATPPADHRAMAPGRVRVAGKFLCAADVKWYVHGVTYGPFRPDADGNQYPAPIAASRDLRQIADAGFNAIRTYTVPPKYLLDIAHRHSLRVMVGLPWEQHITFLDHRARRRAIRNRLRDGVRACAAHPAVLCYAVGNEIPAPIVRWYGARRVERWLGELCDLARQTEPTALLTYVNYPSTEYLDLPFLDLVAFNVYLETPQKLGAYLARLQNLAGDRPLLVAELGLDSLRQGEARQAEVLSWQIQTAFAGGAAGTFVFCWTDEWHRGGTDITDWQFGLTRADRSPKPALQAVSQAIRAAPFGAKPPDNDWPAVSVVVCSHNGGRTIARCLAALSALDYPDYEVIVVDDGSTDATPRIARGFDVRLIRTPNHGLSHARNLGLRAARGKIVAYIDDDAYPDPHWLRYLVRTLRDSGHTGVGGPNLCPPEDGWIAQCVARSPGGPSHVLLSDTEAEHIPGCNMAFWRQRLLEVGGFDQQFRIAGDDVDICWRLQEKGWTLGFSPAAMVWHHRRSSIRAYWKQQLNYGRAEAMLERKWPAKYNAAGYPTWAGRLYGNGYIQLLHLSRRRIYHGTWGTALFQSVYHTTPNIVAAMPVMPEWYLLTAMLVLTATVGGLMWAPLLWAAPLAGLMFAATMIQAARSAARALRCAPPPDGTSRASMLAITFALHLIQPMARLLGRMSLGLTPWRLRGVRGFTWPRPRSITLWSEQWQCPQARLGRVESLLSQRGAVVLRGGDYDRWDLELRAGMAGASRIHMTVEEHGGGKQLVRFRVWPRVAGWAAAVDVGLVATAGVLAETARHSPAAAAALVAALIFSAQILREAAASLATALRALRQLRDDPPGNTQPARHHSHGQ
ncbi:glycosyltransferase [Fontivita pretiosa]|uniref:glycosyltransferase n=1 Tax=Fontivita pretiosa TaxID=2989684 RepID=UPI003D186C12